jgi:DNA-binding HxlR family transcriptional regulator
LAGISPRTLSLRLRALEEQEIVERHTFAEVPPRVEYALTEKGRALLPIIDDMRAYGEDWLGGSDLGSPEAECVEPGALAVA